MTLKDDVFAVLEEKGLEGLTQKKVRRLVETKQRAEEKSLDSKKEEIKGYVDEFVSKQADDSEESEEESEEEKKPKKGTKRKAEEEPEKRKLPPVKTRSGAIAPKGVKADQGNAMRGKKFVQLAEDLNVEIFGNEVSGFPRTFTSGNRGWYAGGKIEVKVGKKTLWAQLGINITVIGSKDWDE